MGNRVIKFRFWATDEKVFYKWDESNLKEMFLDKLVIPQQFTGLTDKNGVEIYEADIIRLCNNNNGSFEVLFKNAYQGGWNLKTKTAINTISLGARESKELEVIGNIYQNPDLLK